MYNSNEKSCKSIPDVSYPRNRIKKASILVCSSQGTIFALNKTDGSFIWSIKFPARCVANIVSLLVTDSDTVIAGTTGATVCMDLFTGAIKWRNNGMGFGYGMASVTSNSTKSISIPVEEGLPPYSASSTIDTSMVYAAAFGRVMAINGDTGKEIWRYNCPGSGYYLPIVIVEPPAPDKAHTGNLLWQQKIATGLEEDIRGMKYMALATPISSRLASETSTAYSQNPAGQTCELSKTTGLI
ncbi:hypothetical protein BDB01DRAFT_854005 [Pilobolus umbonatus]|nr:hypothetical protein BDB01DRAFT_854005 [Pilobolus umbonatus]